MGHVVADYPDRGAARQMIANMAAAGVRLIEIQIPFSEPVADGPVFMAANHDALQRGVSTADAFALMSEVSAQWPQVDFIFMCYLNIIFKSGDDQFAAKAAAAGARALIIPDLPVENSAALEAAAAKHGLTNIRLVAPNTTDARLQTILSGAKGLVYAVARAGVTGSSTSFSAQLQGYIDRIRQVTPLPVGLGFGVRAPEDIARLKGLADIAIIGTAALQAWQTGGDASHRDFWKKMSTAAATP
jgi:tryptophan synthase alpha chain